MDSLRDELLHIKARLQEARAAAADTSLSQLAARSVIPLPRIQLRTRRNLRGHLAKIYALDWASDSRQIVTASQDGKLIIWDAYTTNKLHAIPLRSTWVMACCYSPSRNLVASGGLDNVLSIYCPQTRDGSCRMTNELIGHAAYITDCQFLNDGQLLTSSGDRTCALWDIEHAQQLVVFRGHSRDVICLDASAGPSTFISGSCDSTAILWDVRTKRAQQCFEGHESDINSVKFFPNQGQAFVTGSEDASCRLFDIRADQQVGTYLPQNVCSGVTSVALSSSGRLLMSGCDNFEVNVWDTLLQQKVGAMAGHDGRVSCLGVSADGMALCTGSWDSTVKIWTI